MPCQQVLPYCSLDKCIVSRSSFSCSSLLMNKVLTHQSFTILFTAKPWTSPQTVTSANLIRRWCAGELASLLNALFESIPPAYTKKNMRFFFLMQPPTEVKMAIRLPPIL